MQIDVIPQGDLRDMIDWFNKEIFRYPFTMRVVRRQKTSLVEVYGFGREKGRNKLFPVCMAFSNLALGISPVVE